MCTHILFDLCQNASKIFWKALVVATLSLSFKGTTHAYIRKISMTLDKNWNRLLHLLSNYISARTAPKILSLRDDYTFGFSYFPIIGLCNSSVNIHDFTFNTRFYLHVKQHHQKTFYQKVMPIVFCIFRNIKCLIT